MKNEVIEFIEQFAQGNPILIEKFTQGYCYYFAVMLKARFPGGKIFYHPIQGHFYTEIEGLLYDIRGGKKYAEVGDWQTLIAWDTFKEYDLLLYNRIVRDCVLKTKQHDDTA